MISGYRIYRNDRNTNHAAGGVCILIKAKISHYKILPIECMNLETVAIKLETNSNSYLNIISTYKQPNKQLIEDDMIKLFNTNEATLVIGDLNSKNQIWGCRASNPSGTKLNDITSRLALLVMAPNDYTHYPYRPDHQPDILDIVVMKNFNEVLTQEVLIELDSDHAPVIISSQATTIQYLEETRLINGIVDWKKFRNLCDDNLKLPKIIITEANIEKAVHLFTERISNNVKSAIKQAFPKKRFNVQFNLPPKYIFDLIKEKNYTRRLWIRTRDPRIKTKLNNLTHRVKRELD